MSPVSPDRVRSFLMRRFEGALAASGISPEQVPDDFDLLSEGVIDSLGILETITALEEELGLSIDFEELDPDQLTIVGPFCRFVSEKSGWDAKPA